MTDNYVNLKDRLVAWWDGANMPGGGRIADGRTNSDDPNLEITVDESDYGWSDHRIKACQMLWGTGYLHPGGESYCKRMVQPAQLEAENRVIDLTAGFGGVTQFFQKKLDCRVECLETDDFLAERTAAALEIEVDTFDPDELGLERRGYGKVNGIFSRDLMYQVDKAKALLMAYAMLQPQGSYVFTDFILTDDDEENEQLSDWRAAEPRCHDIWTVEQYRAEMKRLNFDVHILQDESEVLVKIVMAGWQACLQRLENQKMTRGVVTALVNEADIWLHRLRAIDSGQLKYVMIHARNPEKKIRKLTV